MGCVLWCQRPSDAHGAPSCLCEVPKALLRGQQIPNALINRLFLSLLSCLSTERGSSPPLPTHAQSTHQSCTGFAKENLEDEGSPEQTICRGYAESKVSFLGSNNLFWPLPGITGPQAFGEQVVCFQLRCLIDKILPWSC